MFQEEELQHLHISLLVTERHGDVRETNKEGDIKKNCDLEPLGWVKNFRPISYPLCLKQITARMNQMLTCHDCHDRLVRFSEKRLPRQVRV